MDRYEFAQYLKSLRTDRKMTQAEVAKALGVGFSQSIAAFESGRIKFPKKHTVVFCSLMGIPLKKFLDLMVEVYENELTANLPVKREQKSA